LRDRQTETCRKKKERKREKDGKKIRHWFRQTHTPTETKMEERHKKWEN